MTQRSLNCLTLALLLAIPRLAIADDEKAKAFAKELQRLAKDGKLEPVVKLVESQGTPIEIARAYFSATRVFYRGHDLTAMLSLGQSSMKFFRGSFR